MGMLLEMIGTPIMTLLDQIAAFRISWVPAGVLILGAVVYFSFMGSFLLLEKAFPRREDESEMDKVNIKEICLALNCALIAVFVTEFPGESFMLSSIASDISIHNFAQWPGMSKFFFWCAIINAGSIVFTQVILSKHWGLIFSLLLTCICGAALGHALIPLIVWLHDDVSMLFAIVLPIVEGLLIGAMYIGSVFGIIPIDIADALARNAEKNRPDYRGPSAAELWKEADDSLRRHLDQERRSAEPRRRPRVEVTRRDGFFVENLKVSSDGERYYDDRDGEWHKVDDIDN